MTTYQVAGTTIILLGDGTTYAGNIAVADSINPITGGMGVNTVKIINSSAANVADVTWTPETVTYSFVNVPYNTDSVFGLNAVINVTVASSGYTVTFTDGGIDYVIAETITIGGVDVGGASVTNDIVITITDISVLGAITGFTITGTPLWPQSVTSQVILLPNSESFIQVTNSTPTGVYFTSNCGDGNVYISPVTVIG